MHPEGKAKHGTVDHLLAIWRHKGQCRSLAQMSGSNRVARRPVWVGAVAALCCCTFSGGSSQRPIVCKMRLVVAGRRPSARPTRPSPRTRRRRPAEEVVGHGLSPGIFVGSAR